MTTLPTLAELYDSILNDLQSEFTITIPVFGPALLRAIAVVMAGCLKLVYLFVGSVQKNIFVDSADPDQVTRWGQAKMGRNPFPARQAQYVIEVTGTIGAVIPAQSTWKSDDNSQSPGKLYILDAAYTTTANPDVITVRALEAGTGSALADDDTLTATAPIALIASGASVNSEAVAPIDAENIEDYRNKAIISYRLEPQGGARSDYRIWGLDAQGVKQIYPYASSGHPNEIDVYVEATVDDSVDGKGTPGGAILADVDAVIELDPDATLPIGDRGRRPMTVMEVNVMAIVPLDVDIEIVNYVGYTVEKEAAIQAALSEAISAVRPYIDGVDVVADKNDTVSINQAISIILAAVPGSIFDSVNVNVDGTPVPASGYVFDNGNIPHFNSVTFI